MPDNIRSVFILSGYGALPRHSLLGGVAGVAHFFTGHEQTQ